MTSTHLFGDTRELTHRHSQPRNSSTRKPHGSSFLVSGRPSREPGPDPSLCGWYPQVENIKPPLKKHHSRFRGPNSGFRTRNPESGPGERCSLRRSPFRIAPISLELCDLVFFGGLGALVALFIIE